MSMAGVANTPTDYAVSLGGVCVIVFIRKTWLDSRQVLPQVETGTQIAEKSVPNEANCALEAVLRCWLVSTVRRCFWLRCLPTIRSMNAWDISDTAANIAECARFLSCKGSSDLDLPWMTIRCWWPSLAIAGQRGSC